MRTRGREAGFSLAALIFFVTATSMFIAAAVPAYQMQAKREMEEELIFRGQEYVRAIQKYRTRFMVYPTSVDQLLSTNGLRFLRKAYKDPITGKEFRLIIQGSDGSLTGSKTFSQNVNTQPLFGDTQSANPSGGTNSFPSARGGNPPQTSNPRGGASGTLGTPGTPAAAPFGGGGSQPFNSVAIIGVASDSHKQSVKVYGNRQKYDEWEFIAVLGQQPGRNNNGGVNPPNPQAPGGPGSPPVPPNSGRGFNPGNPVGPPPGGGGNRGGQTPYGFGNPPTPPTPGKFQ